jgi:hypothetical protein
LRLEVSSGERELFAGRQILGVSFLLIYRGILRRKVGRASVPKMAVELVRRIDVWDSE